MTNFTRRRFIRTAAATAWVAIIVGAALRSVDPRAEEAALLTLPGWRVLAGVSARQAAGGLAVALGLATRLSDDPLADATALAHEIASKSPHAIRAGKKVLERAYTADPVEGLKLEEGIQRTLLGSPNQIEAVKSNMEKRPPAFSDPD